MDCKLIRPELVAYHFGSVAAGVREDLEAHLPQCPDCLRAYLALKRELETAGAGPRPSPAARDRLRRAVARELAAPARPRASVGWRQTLGLGFAAAATAAALLGVVSVRGQLERMAGIAAERAAVEVRAE